VWPVTPTFNTLRLKVLVAIHTDDSHTYALIITSAKHDRFYIVDDHIHVDDEERVVFDGMKINHTNN